ncbi:hypothetical protein A9B99_08885 [Mangrovibacter phragmitis]|uniref:Uncharacterized protein n=1 Tax=Mangrovibacter phragmitis TaxID=1691903 RepID=A0A1B7L2D6_9ENTR|nr:hypothetical protein [Mangrovibacter phragmitis]OAT76421.1 hypothetical protein A9B99_08885 [Mangrovibacter phragmitis]
MPTRSGTRTGRRGKPNVREAAILPATKGVQGASAPCGRRAQRVRGSSMADTARNLLSTGRFTVTVVTVPFTCSVVVSVHLD